MLISSFVWLGLVVYTTLVFWVSTTIPSAGVARLLGPYDKIIHFAMYSLLFYLAASAFHRSVIRKAGRVAALAFVYSAVIGALTEVLQSITPGRTASAADWVANIVGAGSSMAFLWACRSRLAAGYF